VASVIEKIRASVGSLVDSGVHINAAKASEKIAKKLGLSERMVQYTHVALRNAVYEPQFKETPYKKRVLFLPHCVRSSKKCKAKYNSFGLECKNCGACDLCKAKKIAEKLGYKKVFIVPGGSMVRKILEKYKPKASIGVCCFNEALLAYELTRDLKVTPQVVLLLKDGCKDTKINLPELKEKLELIEEKNNKK